MTSNAMRPNTPLELMPLRVERDRADFGRWNRLNRFPDLSVRRSSAAGRWAAPSTPVLSPMRDPSAIRLTTSGSGPLRGRLEIQ
jgi:hypothetical protein